MFDKSERSTFKYWFAHWCAYNMTALNLKCWKFKYLFHDILKPWLKILLNDYSKVRKIHRKNAKHHLTYKNVNKIDWEAMVIDWECSRYTKTNAPMNARETYEYFVVTRYKNGKISDEIKQLLEINIPPILKKMNL